MKEVQINQRLFYEYQVLCARYSIRQFHLNCAVCGIYENVAQLLGLIRFQLARLECDLEEQMLVKNAIDLMGKAINNLRYLSRCFNLGAKLVEESCLPAALEYEIKLIGVHKDQLEVSGFPSL